MCSVASDHIALFQLGINDRCKEWVKALMENDMYVYPGEWGVTDKGKKGIVIHAIFHSI